MGGIEIVNMTITTALKRLTCITHPVEFRDVCVSLLVICRLVWVVVVLDFCVAGITELGTSSSVLVCMLKMKWRLLMPQISPPVLGEAVRVVVSVTE